VRIAHRLVVVAGQVGSIAELAGPLDTDIGRELATDLVAQPQARLQAADTVTDLVLLVIFAVDIGFDQSA
jgi:hypothetical protein